MLIKVDQFAGMTEAVSTRLMQEKYATKAVNCRVDRGLLEPIRANSGSLRALPFGTKTIYRYAGQHWFTWNKDIDVAKTPMPYDVTDRIVYTGDVFPKQTRNDIALGVNNQVNVSYKLGVSAPNERLVVTVGGTPLEEDDPEYRVESRYYIYTYVTAWGEEGPPSLPSHFIEATMGQTVTLMRADSIPTIPHLMSGGKIRVYRSAAGSSGAAFQFMVELPINANTFVDAVGAADLGEVLPSLEWDGPPDDSTSDYPSGQMLGIRTLSSGSLVGFSGNTLVYSVPYLPHAWPYFYPVKDKIVAIEVTSVGVLVATEGRPVIALGFDPQAIVVQELDDYQACTSKRSMVDMGEYAIYASPDGLVGMENGSVEVLTRGLFRPEQWQRFKPDTIHGYRWENKYVGFYNKDGQKGGFVFTPGDQHNAFVELSFYADAGFYDSTEDVLYLAINGQLVKFDSEGPVQYTWTSKDFELPRPAPLNCMQIIADSYPVNLSLIRDGVAFPITINDSDPIRIAAGRAKTWRFSINSDKHIHMVAIGSSMSELANA